MTKAELFQAVHEYASATIGVPPRGGYFFVFDSAARAKLFDAIYAWAEADRQRNRLGPVRTLGETFDPALVRELLRELDVATAGWTEGFGWKRARRLGVLVKAVCDSARKPGDGTRKGGM